VETLTIFFILGLTGMYCHYMVKYLRAQTRADLWQYIFSDADSTLYACSMMSLAILGLYTHGLDLSGHHLLMSFLIGYTSDHLINKG